MAERNCKKCFHFAACKEVASHSGYIDINYTESQCENFICADDVVEVVKCKDCAHYIEMKGFDYNGRKARSCVWHSALRGENDYCSDAIRTSKRTPKERGGE